MKIKTSLKLTMISSLLTGSLLFGSASAVLAQDVTPAPLGGGTRAQAACSAIAGKITNAITNSQNNQVKVIAVMSSFDAFLTGRAGTFQQKYGMSVYNTLAGYFSTLHNTYGSQIKTDWTTYTQDLSNLQNMSNAGNCGTTNGLFAAQIRQTRSNHLKVRPDIEAYRDYVNNTIRYYVRSLTPLPSPTPTVILSPTPFPTDTSSPTNPSASDQTSPPTSNNVCTDQKPSSAPVLLSAVANDQNQVVLSWSKASDPVTYYLVAYGTKSGVMEYGNPNVGDQNTTSYTAGSLSGNTTYYFEVRAGNNCMPGDFSNEMSAKVSGPIITTSPAPGFLPGVLSANQAPQGSQNSGSVSVPRNNQPGNKAILRIGSITSFIQSTWDNIAHFFTSLIPIHL